MVIKERISRRTMLSGSFMVFGTLPFAAWSEPVKATSGRAGFLGTGRTDEGRYVAAFLSPDLHLQETIDLPLRGHGIAVRPDGNEAIVFARRPGTYSLVISLHDRSVVNRIDSPSGRHFYGHGTYSLDGRMLFATENDIGRGVGVIGLYDVMEGYRRIGEMPSGGVGPHEIRMMPDGRVLAVANGGIKTHPEFGRAKLNIASMRPNLSLLDAWNGKSVVRWEPSTELHRLSIRHLDVNQFGDIAFGIQYEGLRDAKVPLVGVRTHGGQFVFADEPEGIVGNHQNYIGSIRFDASGFFIMASAPKGGISLIWEVASRRYLGSFQTVDASAIAPVLKSGAFVVAGGDGSVHRIKVSERMEPRKETSGSAIDWDNHLREI